MTNEVDWVLEQFGSVVGSTTTPLRRVDRDESRILEQDVRDIQGELTDANYIGATHVETSEDPMGSQYDLQREVVVGVRLTGLHHSEYGWIDSSGEDGIAFDELVRRCKDALWAERKWPAAGPADVSYPYLELQNEANTSHQWADAFRADWDVVFMQGFHDIT